MTLSASSSGPRVRPPIAILGVPFDNVTIPEALDTIAGMVDSRQPHYLVTANVDFLVQAREDVELRRILFDAHLVLCDGTPLVWASRILGNPLPERVAGSDLVPLLMQAAAEKGYRLFFLGATPESANRAVALLRKKHPKLLIVGHYSPPFNKLLEMDHEEIKRRIREARPDVLFVSLGCPKQEKWMAMHYRGLGVPVTAGVGATIDFLAGRVKRAPRWMQRSGTEWLFRLAQEPRRLFRRYLKDLWVFGWSILAQWWRLQFCAHLRGPWRSQTTDLPVQPLAASDRLGPALCLHLPERLDFTCMDRQFQVAHRVVDGDKDCLLDLGRLQFIDSTGVGFLIRLHKAARARGRELVLVAPRPPVQRALALMRLNGFFTSVPDFQTAERLLKDRAREQLMGSHHQAGDPFVWQGEITAANAEAVWRFMEPRLDVSTPCRELVVDLAAVRFIDSTGLGLMVRAKKLAQSRQARLTFASPGPVVRNVVRLAGLQEFLLQEAPNAFPWLPFRRSASATQLQQTEHGLAMGDRVASLSDEVATTKSSPPQTLRLVQ